jgi:hypothetical protein
MWAVLAGSWRGGHEHFSEGFKLFSHTAEGGGKVGNQRLDSSESVILHSFTLVASAGQHPNSV